MVLRVGTLGRGFACLAAVCVAATAAVGQTELDVQTGFAASVFEFDPVLQADLDALLADPVVLDAHADLDRLRVLPWLDAAALDVLSAALPVENVDALAVLPPWDAARVRMLAPFVQPAPVARAAVPAWRATLGARPGQVELQVELRSVRTVIRPTRSGPPGFRGALQWTGKRAGLAAGGLRATQCLGLVLGPQAWGTDASAAIFPVVAPVQRTVARVPWLQGIALYTPGGGLAVYGGRGAAGALQAVSVGCTRVRASVVRMGSAVRTGAFLRVGDAREWVAAELARGPEGTAGALAAQVRTGSFEIASRLDLRPEAWGETGGPGSTAAAGAVQARGRWHSARAVLAARVAHGWRTGNGGLRGTTSAPALDASWRAAGCVFAASWAGRETTTGEVDGVDAVQRGRRRESWGVRAARATARRSLAFDVRRWHDTSRDQAWQIQWSVGPAARRFTLALAAFGVSHSRALGLPVGGTAADSRLRGRGMRWAGGVQARARGLELRAVGAAIASAERGWEVQAHAAVLWRRP